MDLPTLLGQARPAAPTGPGDSTEPAPPLAGIARRPAPDFAALLAAAAPKGPPLLETPPTELNAAAVPEGDEIALSGEAIPPDTGDAPHPARADPALPEAELAAIDTRVDAPRPGLRLRAGDGTAALQAQLPPAAARTSGSDNAPLDSHPEQQPAPADKAAAHTAQTQRGAPLPAHAVVVPERAAPAAQPDAPRAASAQPDGDAKPLATRAQPTEAPVPHAAKATSRSTVPPAFQSLTEQGKAEAPRENGNRPALPATAAPVAAARLADTPMMAPTRLDGRQGAVRTPPRTEPTPPATTPQSPAQATGPAQAPVDKAMPEREPRPLAAPIAESARRTHRPAPPTTFRAANPLTAPLPAAAPELAAPSAPDMLTPIASTSAPAETAHPVPAPAEPSARAAADQVARHIARIAVEQRPGMTEITLSPEELGRVRISLSSSENGLQVQVIAERAETLDLLRRNASLLAQDLAALGYEGASLGFGQRGGQPGDSRDFDAGSGAAPQPAEDTPTLPQTPDPTRLAGGHLTADRIDIRL